jgi:hypothetical protein
VDFASVVTSQNSQNQGRKKLLILFIFFQKKSCFSTFGIIMFSMIYRHYFFWAVKFRQNKGGKKIFFHNIFLGKNAKLQKRNLKKIYSKFEL